MALFNENIRLIQNRHFQCDNAAGYALLNHYRHFYLPYPILAAFFQLLFFMAQFGFY